MIAYAAPMGLRIQLTRPCPGLASLAPGLRYAARSGLSPYPPGGVLCIVISAPFLGAFLKLPALQAVTDWMFADADGLR